MSDSDQLAYIADNVMVSQGMDRIHDAVLGIDREGQVVLLRTGDEPAIERIIASAPAGEVTATRPRSGIGMGMVLQLTFVDTTYTVSPQSVTNSAFVTPKQFKRSRAAVRAFEAALESARASG